MDENYAINNSSRLSLALENLPLTPIGMKSPSSTIRQKTLGKDSDRQNKLSRRRLKPFYDHQCMLTPLDQFYPKDNFKLPPNLKNITTRRRLKNKHYKGKENNIAKGKDIVGNNLESIPVSNSIPTYICNLGPSTNEGRRDSLFTDIDEGSFIEFVQNPSECLPNLSKELLPQFYYTCNEDNETKYSTSSKTQLAPVGFHKFVNTMKDKNALNKIVEESSSEETVNSIQSSFKFDESVIAGSHDILALKGHHRNLNRVFNSTKYPFDHQNIYEMPNISSLTIHNSYLDDRQRDKPNLDSCKLTNEIKSCEYILSDSDDDDDDYDDSLHPHHLEEEKERYAQLSKILVEAPQQHSCYQRNHNKRNSDKESLFTGDISVLPSISDHCIAKNVYSSKQSKINVEDKNKCFGPLPLYDNDLTKEDKIAKLNEEVIYTSDVDERIVGWVMNSPFRDGSFGPGFMNEEVQSPKYTRNNRKSLEFDINPFSEQSLVIRLSDDHCHGGDSGNTVFTLERVAEFPTNKNIDEFGQPCAIVKESDSLDSEDQNSSYRKVASNDESHLSLITQDISILSVIPDCQKSRNICDATGSDHLKGKNKSLVYNNTDVAGLQFHEPSSDESFSTADPLLSRSGFGKKIIIYDSDSNEERSEVVCNLVAPNTIKEHLKPICSSGNTKCNREKWNVTTDVSNGLEIEKMLKSSHISNADKNLSSNDESEIFLNETKLSAEFSTYQFSSKSSLPIISTRKYIQSIAKPPSDHDSIDAAVPTHISTLGKSLVSVLQKGPIPKSGEDAASNMSLHLHLTGDDSDSGQYCLKTDAQTMGDDRSNCTNSFNNSNLKQNSLHNRNNILKSKSSSHVNVLNLISDDDLSSDESLPDIDIRKPLAKSKALKQLLYGSRDSETETSLLKLRREFNILYNSEKKVEQINFVKETLPEVSQSTILDKRRKPHLERKNSIPVLCLSSSDTSDDNFEDYIKRAKKWVCKTEQQLIHRENSVCDKDFIVSDSTIEYASSPSPKKVFKKGTQNFPHNEIISKKTTPNTNSKWRSTQRIISSSSSDSEEENFVFHKPKKILEPEIPKQKPASFTGKQTLKSTTLKDSVETHSFLASFTADTPLSRAHLEAIPFIKNFKKQKDALIQKLYILFNANVFNNQLPSLMKITWNPRMTKTAGFCYYQMDKSKPSGRGARIELSTKVIDAPGRLRDTFIHELCHAASWIISGYKSGHGPLWKSWANKAMKAFPELPFINRCHSYEINCKYTYKCSNCGYSIGRHSKSLNTEKKVCGYCYGKFELFVNYEPKGSTAITKTPSSLLKGTPKTPRTPNSFALYVKENYGSIKRTQKVLKHKDIMKALSEGFAKLKLKA